MKKFILFKQKTVVLLSVLLCTATISAENGLWYYFSKAVLSDNLQNDMRPAATFSDGTTLVRVSEPFEGQFTTRDVILQYPDGKIVVGAINIVEKGKEKGVLNAIGHYNYQNLIYGTFPDFPEDAFKTARFLSKYESCWAYKSTKQRQGSFPFEVMFGCSLDTLGNKRCVYPGGALKDEAQTKALLCGQWGKNIYQPTKFLGVDMPFTWLTEGFHPYNWTFNSNGTGTVSWGYSTKMVSPQREASSWRGGRYNRKHVRLTGGYEIELSGTITMSFSWRIDGEKLGINYKTFSYSAVSTKPVYPSRDEYATEAFYREIVAQIKADFPNEDEATYKKEILDLLVEQKKVFTPSEVPFTILAIDKDVVVLSNPLVYGMALTHSRTGGCQSIREQNIIDSNFGEDGTERYFKALLAYEACLKKMKMTHQDSVLQQSLPSNLRDYYTVIYSDMMSKKDSYKPMDYIKSTLPKAARFQESMSFVGVMIDSIELNNRLLKSYKKRFPDIYDRYREKFKNLPSLPSYSSYQSASASIMSYYLDIYLKKMAPIREEQSSLMKYVDLREKIERLHKDILGICDQAKKCKKPYLAFYQELNIAWHNEADNIGDAAEKIEILTSLKDKLSAYSPKELNALMKDVKTAEQFRSALEIK